jgi:hypothetical protein
VEIAILRYRLYDIDRRAPMLAAGGDGSQVGRRVRPRPRWPTVSVASLEAGAVAAMAVKLSAAAVPGPTSQVRWAGTENRRIDPCAWPA